MAVDQTGEQSLSLQDRFLRAGGDGLRHVGKIADGNYLVAADGNRLSVSMLGNASEHLGVKQQAFGFVAALGHRDWQANGDQRKQNDKNSAFWVHRGSFRGVWFE